MSLLYWFDLKNQHCLSLSIFHGGRAVFRGQPSLASCIRRPARAGVETARAAECPSRLSLPLAFARPSLHEKKPENQSAIGIRKARRGFSAGLAFDAFKAALAAAFLAGGAALAEEANKNIDFLTLSVGIQHDHALPESYQREKLIFEGTYKRLTGAVYRKSENHIRFVPKKQGVGVLIIKNAKKEILKKINIEVRKIDLHKMVKEINDLLITVDGINVKILDGRVFIDGEIFLPRDMDRIGAVLNEYKKYGVTSLVTFSPQAQIKLAKLIEKKIENPEVTVEVIHSKFILRGTVEEEEEKIRADRIARLYTRVDLEGSGSGPGKVRKKGQQGVINLIEIRKQPKPKKKAKKKQKEEKMIQIVVHYVELHKSFNKGFAFQWSPTVNDGTSINVTGGGVASLPFALTATVKNLLPKLNWAKSFNFARVLHNASLILKNNGQGSIDVGTGVPITQQTEKGLVTTTPQTEALTALVKPKIVGPQKAHVDMQVQFTATNITGQTSSGPLTTNRKLQTSIRVRGGTSAVIGGLISSNIRKNFNRLPPGAGESPPLFTLLSSKNYDVSRSQFVVFITPTIITSASTGVNRVKKKFKLDEG